MTALYSDEFFLGLFAAAARRGARQIVVNDRFHAAVQETFETIAELDPTLDVRFRVRVHPIHRDSEVVLEGITRAMRAGLAVLQGPSFKTMDLNVETESAAAMLARLPGGATLYDSLAAKLLSLCSHD
jgi:hypothetical protein